MENVRGRLHKSHLWVMFFVLAAAILRLPNLGRESLWFDEAVSYLAAQLPLPQLLNNTIQSSHPPLYYLVIRGWMVFVPDTDGMLRLPGVFFSLMLVAAVYGLTWEVYRRRPLAIAASFLTAISPFIQLYSHELRMYTQLTFLVTLTGWAYLRARRTGQWQWWLLFGVSALAAQYTHLFAGFILMAIGTHALWHHQNRQAFWRTAVILGVVMMMFLPWLLLMMGESQVEVGSLRPLFQDRPANETEIDYLKLMNVLVFLVVGPTNTVWFGATAIFLTLAFWIILGLELRKVVKRGETRMNSLPGLVILSAVGGPILVFYLRPFFLPERTMAAAAPFLLIFLTWGMIRRQSPLPFLWAGTAVLMSIAAVSFVFSEPIKPPYREAMEFVSSQAAPEDVVVHTSDGSYLPALRYADVVNHVVLAGDPDPRKPDFVYRALGGDVWSREKVVRDGRLLWLVVSLEHSVTWQQEQVNWFAETLREFGRKEIGGIIILQYQKSTESTLVSR